MTRLEKRWPFLLTAAILIIASVMYAATWSQLRYSSEFELIGFERSDDVIGEIKSNDLVCQDVKIEADVITRFSVLFATYNRANADTIHVSLVCPNGEYVYRHDINAEALADNSFYDLPLEKPLTGLKGQTLTLQITSDNGSAGNAVTLYKSLANDLPVQINGVKADSGLCLKVWGKSEIPYTQIYWALTLAIAAIAGSYSEWVLRQERAGRETLAGNAVRSAEKYWFLLCQLVIRDFKTKYKRSALGMFWSLLNPLMTMTVQYIVFSQLFRFEIQNYPVYLLSGIVFFNYMSDATSQAMMCIVQNASLINKVYMPKYIFPFSRVLSCGINFLLSLVALYIMIIASGIRITSNHIFLMYGILCVFLFTLGVSFFLSALMVFFRDAQFLYGIFLQLWLYLTPLFYPETILPDWVMRIVELNPMYHFIRFIRIIILHGVLPEFKAWVYCAIFAVVPFILGYYIFKKVQPKFILYI